MTETVMTSRVEDLPGYSNAATSSIMRCEVCRKPVWMTLKAMADTRCICDHCWPDGSS